MGTPSTALVTCNQEINSYLTGAEKGFDNDSSNPGSLLWEAKRLCLLQLGKNEGVGKIVRRWLCCPYNRQQKGKEYGLETNTGSLGGQCWPENKQILIGPSLRSLPDVSTKEVSHSLWIQVDWERNLNSVKVELKPFLERTSRMLEVTDEQIQCSRRGPS